MLTVRVGKCSKFSPEVAQSILTVCSEALRCCKVLERLL